MALRWRLFHLPFVAVFGVLDVETYFGEAVAYKVAGSPILIRFSLLANVEEQVDSLFVGFEVNAVATVSLVANAENIEQEELEQRFELLDVGSRKSSLAIVGLIDDAASIE